MNERRVLAFSVLSSFSTVILNCTVPLRLAEQADLGEFLPLLALDVALEVARETATFS